LLLSAAPAAASPFLFSTGDPDGEMASATRPGTAGKFEIESADDFVAPSPVSLTGATFKGILTNGASISDIGQVRVEIYRVFPLDSQDPPSGHVPTRMNSPSDVALAERDSALGDLLSTAGVLSESFSALNSVTPGGIHAKPNQATLGNGPQNGQEVEVTVSFDPISLPADHYFFVPQVQVNGSGEFLWLSAPKPIAGNGTPFLPDLQSWTRDEMLVPDWLRIGTDIVDGETLPTFNASFALIGQVVPEPATASLVLIGLCGLAWKRGRR
jgi:hypothetical protein